MDALISRPKQDVDLSQPVLLKPMAREKVMSALHSAMEAQIPPAVRHESRAKTIRYNDLAGSLKLWGQFLATLGDGPVNPNEALLDDFLKFVTQEKPNWKDGCRKNLPIRIRTLINSLPTAVLNRPLLGSREVAQKTRFNIFSPETKAALQSFLVDGRCLKRNGIDSSAPPILTGRLLSPAYRESVVDRVRHFLTIIEKRSVFGLTASDAEVYLADYAAQGNRQGGINNLADIQSFFSNLFARGSIDKMPFTTVFAKKNAVDDDFVPPERLAILQDISTVDLKDIVEVRDRLLAICLLYDFALRLGEVIRLKVSDVAINDYIELTIRSEVQKGQGKPTKAFLSFFPESKTLMSAYLRLRQQRQTSHDALIITQSGEPLLASGCRAAVQELCRKLGVKTAKGELPAPHRFRHSFGTCNVAPLGLRLDIYDIMKRLRHTSIELTTRTYISDNPLLSRAKHEEHVRALNVSFPRTGSTTQSTVDHPGNDGADDGRGFTVAENDAIRLLVPFGVVRVSLRKFAESKGVAKKRNGDWFYARASIDDLSQNYFTKQEAMRIIGFSRSAFAYWVGNHGIEQAVIGKVSLVKRDAVLAKSRGVEFKKSA